MNNIRRTMAGISVVALMMSSVFSCSLSKKEESSEEPVTTAPTTEAPTEPEEEFRRMGGYRRRAPEGPPHAPEGQGRQLRPEQGRAGQLHLRH